MVIRKKIIVANENDAGATDNESLAPNRVQPFMLDTTQLRGRIVRLPTVLQDVITAHHYPRPIARIMAEALCLTTLLAGMLKFDGIFTLQIKAEGVLRTMVCDITTDGTLRGYASYDETVTADILDFATLTGPVENKGYLAFTVDQANTVERYQGIVALTGGSLTESVQAYFHQSEQIRTGFITQIEQDENGAWQGAAIMLQQLPGDTQTVSSDSIETDEQEEAWRRSMMLLNTVRPGELLDMQSSLNDLLYRFFHEEGVRVFDPIEIRKGCRCSMEKIRAVLDNLSDDDRLEYAEDGIISVTCEFCNTTYSFPVEK